MVEGYPMKKLWWLLCVSVTALIPVTSAFCAPISASAERGKALFQERCAACHTVGKGPAVGPDLAGVTRKRDRAWLLRMITAPGTLLDSGDPVAQKLLQEFRRLRMPTLGISQQDADAILAYLAKGSEAEATGASVSPTASSGTPGPTGDPELGRSLFSGTTRLRNGGAPCLACHAIAGLPLAGGTLGPDLTTTYSDFGEQGIASALSTLPFPTMRPIYGGRPLLPQEQAHLKAFLAAPAEKEPAEDTANLLSFGIVAAILAIGLIHIIWRKRLAAVRGPFVRRSAGSRRGGR
jgi:mono/diheme cytochrome c family protein